MGNYPPDRTYRGRRSPRWRSFDYTNSGWYFITIKTWRHAPHFGSLRHNRLVLRRAGELVGEAWDALPAHHPRVALDAFVVMPNHVHGVIILEAAIEVPQSLATIMRSFKSTTTRAIMYELPNHPRVWQRSYHDRVIRQPKQLDRVRAYIAGNPARWLQQGR